MDLILVEFTLVHALLRDTKSSHPFLFSLAVDLPVVLLVIHNFVLMNYLKVYVYVNKILLKEIV